MTMRAMTELTPPFVTAGSILRTGYSKSTGSESRPPRAVVTNRRTADLHAEHMEVHFGVSKDCHTDSCRRFFSRRMRLRECRSPLFGQSGFSHNRHAPRMGAVRLRPANLSPFAGICRWLEGRISERFDRRRWPSADHSPGTLLDRRKSGTRLQRPARLAQGVCSRRPVRLSVGPGSRFPTKRVLFCLRFRCRMCFDISN